MHQYIPSKTNSDKKINSDQLSQIVEAILDGKYSWACVLLLRFTGENPLHYIPYRTYNRLVKENNPVGRQSRQETSDNSMDNRSSETRGDNPSSQQRLSKINDLVYLEAVGEQHTPIRGGGNLSQWLNRKIREYTFRKIELDPLNDSSSFERN
ncbi:MAG: hypothetical protein N4J56_003160 [Chroococcidiopsis sp. SAG 2025]|uniref:HetP family heterocyst commitment protein n=1 Tax=Chroococcidiopsis sp. SAG 2025 TaxID=171389 RepID=UPI00293741A6|nr:HetP family heterocyst commitment protein [Chroococcidiopsis sp. SAG 2025]MDV2993506.1 hypothetical protein [Chroococcidiopsis sp. SAG 2025]